MPTLTYLSTQHPASDSCNTSSLHTRLQHFAEDLLNPHSYWQEIRLTLMSSRQYVFLPQYLYAGLHSPAGLSCFITDLCCACQLQPHELQIICVEIDGETPRFAKVQLEWSAFRVSDHHAEVVAPDSNYSEFLTAMLHHSTSLTAPIH